MQLRYLQTLTEIGAEQNSTVVFPMPIDIIKPFLELIEKPGKASATNGATLVPLGAMRRDGDGKPGSKAVRFGVHGLGLDLEANSSLSA